LNLTLSQVFALISTSCTWHSRLELVLLRSDYLERGSSNLSPKTAVPNVYSFFSKG